MKKLRIYLDTSVISHLDAPDVPDKEADTKRLWEDIKAGRYEVVLSDVVYDEVERCAEPKRTFMLSKIAEINSHLAIRDDEAESLSALYFEMGGLPHKSKDDALHIAIAAVSNCNMILSWNFRHIVNLRAMKAVDAVNLMEGYSPIRILSPSMLLGGEE
ncbi:MAG: PIN domain-containing protein [Synergistaceae bacterium]|jgi:predicted nucleic acid-binding protein|nr:PIN domain-containing protein [Synergistaceae bacterium]